MPHSEDGHDVIRAERNEPGGSASRAPQVHRAVHVVRCRQAPVDEPDRHRPPSPVFAVLDVLRHSSPLPDSNRGFLLTREVGYQLPPRGRHQSKHCRVTRFYLGGSFMGRTTIHMVHGTDGPGGIWGEANLSDLPVSIRSSPTWKAGAHPSRPRSLKNNLSRALDALPLEPDVPIQLLPEHAALRLLS